MVARPQKGLTHYLVVLLVVVAAVVAGGGYYVYAQNQKSDETPKINETKPQPVPDIVYLQLPGWDASLHLEDDVRDGYIVASASDDRTIVISTTRLDSLVKQVPECAEAAQVRIMRVLPGEIVNGVTYDIDTLQTDDRFIGVGDYYYEVISLSDCTASGEPAAKLRTLKAQLIEHAQHIMTKQEVEQGDHQSHEGDETEPGPGETHVHADGQAHTH